MTAIADRRANGIRTRNRPQVPGAPFISDLEKAAAGGVATLDETTILVPASQLGTGTPTGAKALFGDQSWGDVATQVEIDAESAARIAADGAEATTRANADTALQANITAEAGIRAAADLLLQPLSQKGAASGYASLNAATKVVETALKADVLATARNIGGVSFDGSAAITPGTSAATPSTTMARDGSGNSAVVQLNANVIQFPATQVPSSDANALDDYEKGSWTPNIGGTATYTSQVGRYVKIGKFVWISAILTINALGTGSTTTISGLPFTSANSGVGAACPVNFFDALAVVILYLCGSVAINAATMSFNNQNAAGASMNASPAIFGAGAQVRFSGWYEAAA